MSKSNNTPSWIPILLCSFVFCVILFIILSVALSLIPIYLNNHSVEKSSTVYSVYTINNVIFTSSNTNRNIRTNRATLSSPAPSSTMIASAQEQLYLLFNAIDARVAVSEATLLSTTQLVLTLKIYFLQSCFACDLLQENLIKKILNQGQIITVYIQYYQDCSLSPVTVGTTLMALSSNINNNQISGPTLTSIQSLGQKTDVCGNTVALAYPTNCNVTVASSQYTAVSINNGSNSQYYCYYFVPSTSASNIKVEFLLISNNYDTYMSVDDITLNSTANLITNGGFQTTYGSSGNSGQPSTVSTCPGTTICSAYAIDADPTTNSYSFYSNGVSITLDQTVAINTAGKEFVYSLGFLLSCFVDGGNSACSFFFRLTTT